MVNQPTPFLEVFFERLANLTYPKDRIDLVTFCIVSPPNSGNHCGVCKIIILCSRLSFQVEKQRSVVANFVAKYSHEYRSSKEIQVAPDARPIDGFHESLWVSSTPDFIHRAFSHFHSSFSCSYDPGHTAKRVMDASTSSTWNQQRSSTKGTRSNIWWLQRKMPSLRWWPDRGNFGHLSGVLLPTRAPMLDLTITLTLLNVVRRELTQSFHFLFTVSSCYSLAVWWSFVEP